MILFLFPFSMPICNNFRYTESEEKKMSDLMLTFIPFKNVGFLGLETEPHHNFPPEPEPEPEPH
jgi:hypothetical protein